MTPQQNSGDQFVANTVDRGPRMVWDKNTTAAGATLATQINFLAHQSSVAGYHVTNLIQPNRIPPPEAMSVMALGWRISPSMLPADWIQVLNNYYWQWTIGRKVVLEGLFDQWPAGVGIAGFAATNSATAALIQSINNGDASNYAQHRFNDAPKTIPAEVNVSMSMMLGQGGTAPALVAAIASSAASPAYGGFDLRLDLDGIYDIPVQ